jgi:hypothetical protein
VSFILFTKSFCKSFKTHSSFFNCISINYDRSQLIVVADLSSEAGDFGFPVSAKEKQIFPLINHFAACKRQAMSYDRWTCGA